MTNATPILNDDATPKRIIEIDDHKLNGIYASRRPKHRDCLVGHRAQNAAVLIGIELIEAGPADAAVVRRQDLYRIRSQSRDWNAKRHHPENIAYRMTRQSHRNQGCRRCGARRRPGSGYRLSAQTGAPNCACRATAASYRIGFCCGRTKLHTKERRPCRSFHPMMASST